MAQAHQDALGFTLHCEHPPGPGTWWSPELQSTSMEHRSCLLTREKPKQGKGWRWKAPFCRCWPWVIIKQKAWLKLSPVSETAAQSPLEIFVPVWSNDKKTPLLNLKCPYLMLQGPPYAALELQRIQLLILVQTGLLTYEKLILFTQEHAKYEKHTSPQSPWRWIGTNQFSPWRDRILFQPQSQYLTWTTIFWNSMSLNFFYLFCHKTAAVKLSSSQVRGNFVRKTLSSVS